jgi:hypothetical protein
MLRTVGLVVLGYIVIAALVFLSFTVAYWLMGAEGAFQPNSYELSLVWILVTVVLGFVAAVVGGYMIAAMARTGNEPKALAAFVFGLGVVFAVQMLLSSEAPPGTREAAVSMSQAMSNAQQPLWVAFLNPIIGALGVLTGARRKAVGAGGPG